MKMNEKLRKELKWKLLQVEEDNNVEVLYCTVSGSRLYGTDHKDSDLDVKFVFAPSKLDVLMKRDKEHIKVGAQTNTKNAADDVDFDGYSVYKFMNLLEKSETGAVDVLFSMFNEDMIVFKNEDFVNDCKQNVNGFQNRNMKAFIGYALGQTKRFGIKGARYGELKQFVEHFEQFGDSHNSARMELMFPLFEKHIKESGYKYVKFIKAPGPRGSGTYEDVTYLTVLGKMFSGDVSFEYFKERVMLMFNQFGNRTKSTAQTEQKVDWKALSHALRVALEVEELLETGMVKFPLKDAKYLLDVKQGKVDVEQVVDEVENTLAKVDEMLLTTDLPENSDRDMMDELVLKYLRN